MLTLVAIAVAVPLIAAPPKNGKKGVPVKGKSDVVKEESDPGKTGARGENVDDPDGADVNKKKDQAGLITKDYKEEDFRPVAEEESYAWLVVKTIFILGFIVGIFYIFLKYVTKKAGINVLGTDAIQVLSMVPIGQNKFLQIIDIAGKVLVLGVSDNSISLITEISDKSEIDRIRILSSRTGAARGKGFQDTLARHISGLLERITERKGKSSQRTQQERVQDTGRVEGDFDLDYLKKQRSRLKNLGNHDE